MVNIVLTQPGDRLGPKNIETCISSSEKNPGRQYYAWNRASFDFEIEKTFIGWVSEVDGQLVNGKPVYPWEYRGRYGLVVPAEWKVKTAAGTKRKSTDDYDMTPKRVGVEQPCRTCEAMTHVEPIYARAFSQAQYYLSEAFNAANNLGKDPGLSPVLLLQVQSIEISLRNAAQQMNTLPGVYPFLEKKVAPSKLQRANTQPLDEIVD